MRCLATAILQLLTAAAWVVTAQSPPTPPPGAETFPPPGYRLVWQDEFDGTRLDAGKWDHRGLGKRRDGVNVRETVSLDGDGHLVLETRRVGSEYHTAMIGTEGRFEPRYGYFECRVRLQTQVGHWSAFWLQSPTFGRTVGDLEASGAEIDIFEYLASRGDRLQHTLHWDGYGPQHKSAERVVDVAGLSAGWHIIGLQWTRDEYVFTVDGRETWRTKEGVSRRPQYLILSLEVGEWAGDIGKATLPDRMMVDYVRVYQREEMR